MAVTQPREGDHHDQAEAERVIHAIMTNPERGIADAIQHAQLGPRERWRAITAGLIGYDLMQPPEELGAEQQKR